MQFHHVDPAGQVYHMKKTLSSGGRRDAFVRPAALPFESRPLKPMKTFAPMLEAG